MPRTRRRRCWSATSGRSSLGSVESPAAEQSGRLLSRGALSLLLPLDGRLDTRGGNALGLLLRSLLLQRLAGLLGHGAARRFIGHEGPLFGRIRMILLARP